MGTNLSLAHATYFLAAIVSAAIGAACDDSAGSGSSGNGSGDVNPEDVANDLAPACTTEEGTALLSLLYGQVEQRCETVGNVSQGFEVFATQLGFTDCISDIECTYNPPCIETFLSTNFGTLCGPEVEEEEDAVDASDAGPGRDSTDDVACYPDDLSGQLLLALVIAPLDRAAEKPILMRVVLERESGDAYTFTLQPIATELVLNENNELVPRVQRGTPGNAGYSPAAREDVGVPAVLRNVTVDSEGRFTLGVDDFTVDADANAVTYRELLLDIGLTGQFLDGELGCGFVSGFATEPITLSMESSTFGFVREENVTAYRGDFVRDCEAPELADVCR